MHRPSLISGIIFAALGVALGAFGAHGLKSIATPDIVAIYTTAVTYQMYHSFALLACGIIHSAYPAKAVRVGSVLFITAIICFSGSLYLLTWAKLNGVGLGPVNAVTPLGGVLFIAGWIACLVGVAKNLRRDNIHHTATP